MYHTPHLRPSRRVVLVLPQTERRQNYNRDRKFSHKRTVHQLDDQSSCRERPDPIPSFLRLLSLIERKSLYCTFNIYSEGKHKENVPEFVYTCTSMFLWHFILEIDPSTYVTTMRFLTSTKDNVLPFSRLFLDPL